MARYPSDLLTLIAYLKMLPGVGSKTAERYAFQLLTWPHHQIKEFADLLGTIQEKIQHCPECQCLMETKKCHFCDLSQRDPQILCLISSARDVYSIEETRVYKGLYHVIGGLLSPLQGRNPEHLQLEKLKKRLSTLAINEVIIALDSTLEGDATALYLKEELDRWGLRASRLAFGLPMGSSLDYVDGGTLLRALTGRQSF